MNLLDARIGFAKCLGDLLHFASVRGHPVIVDEVKRSAAAAHWNATHCRVQLPHRRCERTREDQIHTVGSFEGHEFKPIGIARSVHTNGLAADLYVIKQGEIDNDREPYAEMGTFWKGLHPLARWGGDFTGFADLGHFSFEWRGRK